MKLLFCIKKLKGGGVSTGLLERLNHLANHTDFQIHVLSEFENDPLIQAKFDTSIQFHLLPIQYLLNRKRIPIIGYFHLINAIHKVFQEFINELNPDIITSFNHGYNKEIIPYLKTNGLKIVELRGSYASRKKLKKSTPIIQFLKPKSKKLHNQYDYAVVITKEDLADRTYLKIPKKHIYNSMKLSKEIKPFDDRPNIILAVGTLTHNKNFIDLIEAASLIKEVLQGWQIHIYGEGVEYEYLQQKIRQLSLENIIFLKGFEYDMYTVYNNAKLLVSTSLSEGFGRNLTEALSFKIPLISYNCKCGPKEIIRDGENGFLIDFNVSTLADRLKKLISDQDLLNSYSENTWIDLNKFDFNVIMNEWDEFYSEIIDQEKQ